MKTKCNIPGILVAISFSSFPNSREDHHLTHEIKTAHGIKEGGAKVIKMKLPKEAIDPITSMANAIRNWVRFKTLPWINDQCLLLEVGREKFMTELDAKTAAYYALVAEHFTAKYDSEWIPKSKAMLNGTWREDDYPPAKDAAAFFKLKFTTTPVATSDQFAGVVAEDAREKLEQQYDALLQEQLQAAQTEAWKRLIAPVNHIVTTLSKPDARIFDTLIGNVKAIADIANTLNVAGDSDFAETVKMINLELATVDVDRLRSNDRMKETTLAKAKAVLAKVAEFGSREIE